MPQPRKRQKPARFANFPFVFLASASGGGRQAPTYSSSRAKSRFCRAGVSSVFGNFFAIQLASPPMFGFLCDALIVPPFFVPKDANVCHVVPNKKDPQMICHPKTSDFWRISFYGEFLFFILTSILMCVIMEKIKIQKGYIRCLFIQFVGRKT